MTSENDPYLGWDAAYVLGALSPSERRELEQHLATCPRCERAVGELAGIPGLLGLVPAADVVGPDRTVPPPAPAEPGADGTVVPIALLARRARTSRTRRRLVGAAAAVVLVISGVTAGALAVSSLGDATTDVVVAQSQAVRLEPVDGSGVEADLRLETVAWGTRLAWSCTYPPGRDVDGVEYDLTVVDAAGRRSTVATWQGDTSHAATGLTAATSLSPDEIASIELSVTGRTTPLASATL